MRVTGEFPALTGGISQMPQTERQLNQLDDQVNGMSSLSVGNTKRNPVEFLARLVDHDLGEVFIHTINRDLAEQYLVIVGKGSLRVFDLATYAEVPVAFPDGKDYLDVANPRDHLRAVTVNDFTFILNRTMKPAMDADVTGGRVNTTVQVFEELPPDDEATDGIFAHIKGDPTTGWDDYYVKREDATWSETVKPGTTYKFDGATMPHELVRISDGTFEFRKAVWDYREVGDVDSNPEPTFIGQRINDVFWYQNRLCFLADTSVVMSATSEPFNFWRKTVLSVLPSDRIDVSTSSTRVTKLLYALPFNKSIALLSEQDQFVLSSSGSTSGISVSIDHATSMPVEKTCRPTSIGPDLYFAAPGGGYNTMQQLLVKDQSVALDTADTTQFVPKFLPAGLVKMTSADSLDILFALSRKFGHRNRIYVHEFAYSADEKIQNAWHYWELKPDDVIRDIEVLTDHMYLVIYNPTMGTYTARIALDELATAPHTEHQLYLDDRVELIPTYNETADESTVTLPYTPHEGLLEISAPDGQLIGPETYERSGNVVTFPGRFDRVFAGHRYEHRFRLSQPFMFNNQGEPIQTGKLVIQRMSLSYHGTGFFKLRVQARGRTPLVSSITPSTVAAYTGKTLGSDLFRLGAASYADGVHHFLINANSGSFTVDVINDSHVAAKFLSATWTGLFHANARIF